MKSFCTIDLYLYLAGSVTPPLTNDTPALPLPEAIYSSFCTTTCYHSEDLLYVKVGHDHLYTYSFTILYVYRDMQRMTQ